MRIHLYHQDKAITIDAPKDYESLHTIVSHQFKDSLPKHYVFSYITNERELNSNEFKRILDSKVPELRIIIKECESPVKLRGSEERKILDESHRDISKIYEIDLLKYADEFCKGKNYTNMINEEKISSILQDFLVEKLENEIEKMTLKMKEIISERIETEKKIKKNSLYENSLAEGCKKQSEEMLKNPVWEIKNELQEALKNCQTIIIEGSSHTDKSVQIPRMALEILTQFKTEKNICVVVQSDIAAKIYTNQLAEEMDKQLGDFVGYSLNFEELFSKNTRIKYITYEKLFREASKDLLFAKYDAIIMDDMGQRTLYSDAVSDYLKRISQVRTDLKIIMICDLGEGELIGKYFDSPPILKISNTFSPPEIFYVSESDADFLTNAARTSIQIHLNEGPGDILVFLPKIEYISEVETMIRKMSKKLSKENPKFVPMDIIPFHPLLPIHNIFTVVNKKKEKQKQTGMVRRCILISDILENSISIPNIRYVVDPGLTTDRIYDANLGIESVKVAQISREKAKKRSNSISCSETGKCYRLYTQQTFKEEMEENSTPELLKANLASIILIFIKLQIKEVLDLDSQNIKNALEFLTDLGALRKQSLTQMGEMMIDLPMEPQLAKTIITSAKLKCTESILSIAAMLLAPNCLVETKDSIQKVRDAQSQFAHVDGDHLTLLNIYNSYIQSGKSSKWCEEHYFDENALKSASQIRTRLKDIFISKSLSIQEEGEGDELIMRVKKALVSGYFRQVAILDKQGGNYRILRDGVSALIYPSTLLLEKPELCIYTSAEITTKIWIKGITSVRKEWIVEMAHDFLGKCQIKLDNI